MATIDDNYMEKLVNSVCKTIVEAFENLTIEDVNMYKLGYNKGIDEFLERLKETYKPVEVTDVDMYKNVFKRIEKIADQLKGVNNE